MPEIDERHYLSIRKHSKSEPAHLSLNRYMSGTEVEWGFLVAGICERGRWASRAENRPLAGQRQFWRDGVGFTMFLDRQT